MVRCFTKQEQTVLIVIIGLLLVGWTVKVYRAADSMDAPITSQP